MPQTPDNLTLPLHVTVRVDARALEAAAPGTAEMKQLLDDAHDRLEQEIFRLKHQLQTEPETFLVVDVPQKYMTITREDKKVSHVQG